MRDTLNDVKASQVETKEQLDNLSKVSKINQDGTKKQLENLNKKMLNVSKDLQKNVKDMVKVEVEEGLDQLKWSWWTRTQNSNSYRRHTSLMIQRMKYEKRVRVSPDRTPSEIQSYKELRKENITISNFEFVHKYGGRGIILYVSNKLTCVKKEIEVFFHEYLVVEVALQTGKVITLGVFYRSTNSNHENCFNLPDCISEICKVQTRTQ